MRDRARSSFRLLATLVALGVVSGLMASLPASGAPAGPDAARGSFQSEGAGLTNVDRRAVQVAPSDAQRAAATRDGARVRWNRFGTVETLIRDGGYLATGLSANAVRAARAYLKANHDLFRLSSSSVDRLELLVDAPLGAGHAVLFRQRFGGLAAAPDGLISVAVAAGKVTYVASSSVGDAAAPAAATLTARQALIAAAKDAGRTIRDGDLSEERNEQGWTTYTIKGYTHPGSAQLVAVPVGAGAVRAAWQTVLIDNRGEPSATSSYVDARTGAVLIRENLVDHESDGIPPDSPKWKTFPASPPLDYSSTDTRQVWCFDNSGPDCDRVIGPSTVHGPWDARASTGASSHTTRGNNEIAVENWFSSNAFTVGSNTATPRPGRDYVYDWTNQWYEQRCNPNTTFTSPERNDIDAALTNLHVVHNRMHDWSYHLGFTEATWNMQKENLGLGGAQDDFEQGNGQAGGVVGGPPSFAARDNANQITGPDGRPPITNMYLWQPIAAGFYAPCVDGDYDTSIIGHEYTHAISNRMVAGPNAGLFGFNSRAMGESWSDLSAMEYQHEYGFLPVDGENPFAVGAYATGDPQAAIRNYGMNQSPLNFSDVGYDFACNSPCPPLTQVHADGEIWSAVNFAIRQAMNDRYDGAFPSSDLALQADCADGAKPADQCPGNRRWIQLVFDAWLLLPYSTPTMLHARDAMLAADMIRFGGANQDLLWDVFAGRGFGRDASIGSASDADPIPSFVSPYATEGQVKFRPVDENGASVPNAQLFVGDYTARVTPVADTDAATALGSAVQMVPGTYHFVARANGYGMQRFELTVAGGTLNSVLVTMPKNLASATNGATASGDGVNLDKLIDDSEATNWASLNSAVAGKRVTVHLDPSQPSHTIDRIQVSAMLRQPTSGPDPSSQSRFSALRSFELYTCEVTVSVDCTQDGDYTLAYTSPADAFPAIAPRPRAPQLIIRSFDIPETTASYVRLVVVANQCTGGPAYQGDQDDDPANTTDCSLGSTQDLNVRAAELQVFGSE